MKLKNYLAMMAIALCAVACSDDDNKKEITDEYFYKDITSFTTISEEETTRDGQKIPTDTFKMRGAGIDFECSLTEMRDFETSIRGMKQKLREKKNA